MKILKELKIKNGFKIASNTYVFGAFCFLCLDGFFLITNSFLIHWELKKEIKKLEKLKVVFKRWNCKTKLSSH